MDRIIVRADKPQERAKDICNKIYNSVKQPLREQANLFILKLILY